MVPLEMALLCVIGVGTKSLEAKLYGISVLGGGSVVVDFLFIVIPIVGVCNCSMFCCMLLCPF